MSRHWIHDRILLWSVALILFASIVLIGAQTRPFHPDLTGTSSAQQLTPLAWKMIVVGIGLAFGRAVGTMKRGASLPAMSAAVLVTIGLIVPTLDHVRKGDFHEQSSLVAPAIIAPVGELEGAEWLQNNVAGSPVILTADGPGPDSVGTISALAGYPTVIGSVHAERQMRPGWERMVDDRATDVVTIYTGIRNWPLVSPLLQEYDVGYIVVGIEERARFGEGITSSFAAAEAEGHVQSVFETDGITIYRVVPVDD